MTDEGKSEISKPSQTAEVMQVLDLTHEQWAEHFLLFSQVENIVLRTNPDVFIPLQLKEREPSPLGLFVEASLTKYPTKAPKKKFLLEFWPQHRRSAILGRIIFSDKEGRKYRDVDLKGIGFIYASENEKLAKVGELSKRTSGVQGLLSQEDALLEWKISEKFLKKGIRTPRNLAIIKLDEIIFNGQKLTLAEAIRKGLIYEGFNPVILVRAFGTKHRIKDLKGTEHYDPVTPHQTINVLLEDAISLVSQEVGSKHHLTSKEYIEWFARTLGRNVGFLHKIGYVHSGLTEHNITLDCRITDFDLTERSRGKYQYESDFLRARKSLNTLISIMQEVGMLVDASPNDIVSEYEKSYKTSAVG